MASKLLWHPDLHAYYGEELYYVGLRFSGYRREVIEVVKRHLSILGLRGTCAYEVFGDYDVLLRFWVPIGTFTTEVLPTVGRFENLMTRQVMKVGEAFHWPFPEAPIDTVIDELGAKTDVIKRIQEKVGRTDAHPPEITEFVDGKLAFYGRLDETKNMKFFTALNFQDRGGQTRAQEEQVRARLRSAYEECLGGKGPATNVSIYMGDGFAYAMIKGLVNSAQEARDFVLQITRSLEGLQPFTTTFVVCENQPMEQDYLSDAAFARFSRGTSPWVQTWFPELYQVAGDPDVVSEVTTLLVSHRQRVSEIPMDEKPGRALLKGLLLAVVKRDPAIALPVVLPWFASVEYDLARNWMRFLRIVSELEGKGLAEEDLKVRTELKLLRESGFPRISLGEWLQLYLAALGKHMPGSALLESTAQPAELTEMRNNFAHGSVISGLDKQWRQGFETMLWYAPLHQRLMDLAEQNVRTLGVS